MNVWVASGRLTKDVEVRATEKSKVASFTIAIGRPYAKDGKRETDFFNCVAFGKQAEFLEKYFHKGDKMVVRARFENDNYEKDGKKVYGFKAVVDEVDFADSKKSDGEKPEEKKEEPAEGFMELPDGVDDVFPFA